MMNIDAAPWYPTAVTTCVPLSSDELDSLPIYTAENVMPESYSSTFTESSDFNTQTQTPDSSCWSSRRHDPYRSSAVGQHQPYTSSRTVATSSPDGVVEYAHQANGRFDCSERMYRFLLAQGLLEGPPTYQEFVANPPEHVISAVAASSTVCPTMSSQPYRSAPFRFYPVNVPLPCDAASGDHDHGGVSASWSGGSEATTPRRSSTDEGNKPAAKAQRVTAPVSIPLPRSRQSVDITTGASSPCSANDAVTSSNHHSLAPPEAGSHVGSPAAKSEGSDFPLPAPRSRAMIMESDSYLRCVNAAMQQQTRHSSECEGNAPSHSVVAMINAAMIKNSVRVPSIDDSPSQTMTVSDAMPTIQPTHGETVKVVPQTAAPPPKERQPAPATTTVAAETAVKKPKASQPKKSKDNEWKTVESSGGGHPTASAKGVGSSAKHSQPAPSPATAAAAVTNNKFELVNQKKKTATKKNAKPTSDSDDEELQAAIVWAAASHATEKKKKNKTHRNPDDEDAWLDQVAREGAAAREVHDHEKRESHTEPLLFMGFLKMRTFPTIQSLLPPKPSAQLLQVADALQKATIEARTEATQVRHHVIRRLLSKAMTPSFSAQCPSLVVATLVEACEASIDFDLGCAQARQAIQIARTQRSRALEMLSIIAFCRHCQKLVDGNDCHEDLLQALSIALELNECIAVGWIAQMFAIQLEVSGKFQESLCWHFFAARIGDTSDDARLQCEALTHIAIATAAVGAMDEAKALVQAATVIRARLDRTVTARIAQNMTQVCVQCGDLDDALAHYISERDFAKANKDYAQAAALSENIASVRRSMGLLDQALQDSTEELQLLDLCPQPREIDCLYGLATTLKQLGHITKARESMIKVLRTSREAGDQPWTAKCLAEIADCDAMDGQFEDAISRLAEALRIVDQASPNECKQYCMKVNICEAEWRVLDVLEKVCLKRDAVVEAIRVGDAMRLPNTADTAAILQRKQRKAVAAWDAALQPPSSSQKATAPSSKGLSRAAVVFQASEAYLQQRFFDTCVLERMMNDKELCGVDAMVVYSLRWDEDLGFFAYILQGAEESSANDASESASSSSRLRAVGRSLHLTPAAIQVLIGTKSALFSAFHTVMRDESGNEVYCDTPLFPHRLWYEQKKIIESQPELSRRIATDANYCLEVLYDCFIRPLEDCLPALATKASAKAPRVLFVGDGVVNMMPFPALRDSSRGQHLIDCVSCFKVPSVQHALTIYARRVQTDCQRSSSTGDEEPSDASQHPSIISAYTPDTDTLNELVSRSLPIGTTVHIAGDDEVQLLPMPSRQSVTDVHSDIAEVSRSLIQLTLGTRQRHVRLSNVLLRALLVDCPKSAPLIMDLPVVPDVKEDFSGVITSTKGTLLATSSEIALAWDLSAFPVVVSTRFGAYGSRTIHETGIPVYRALLLAGAQRLLLPTGSSLDNINDRSMKVVLAATTCAAPNGCHNIGDAVRRQMLELRDAGHDITTWCAFALCGLP